MGMVNPQHREDSCVLAPGPRKPTKRMGLKSVVKGVRHNIAAMPDDMLTAFAQLSYVEPESSGKAPPIQMGPRKRKQMGVDVPITDVAKPKAAKIQPVKTQPKGVKQPKSTRSELNAAAKAAKKYRKEQTQIKKAAANAAKADVTDVVPIPKVTPELIPFKAKAVKAEAVKTEAVKAKVVKKVKAPVAKAAAPVAVAPKAKAPVAKAAVERDPPLEGTLGWVPPPKVRRENVSKAVMDGQPMIIKTLSSGKTVSKVDNSGTAITRVPPRGESRGEVQYVPYTVSTGKVPTYDDQGDFVRMITLYEEDMTEQSYLDWIEERPNMKAHTLVGREYKTVRLESRTQVEIMGLTILLSGNSRKFVEVPVGYDHSVAKAKTHISERSRGRKNNVVSIDSKREQGVDTGKEPEPVILSRSKARVIADKQTRKAVELNVRMAAYRAGREMREAAKALRKEATTVWLRARTPWLREMITRSAQITMTYPIIYCDDDAQYELLRMLQEPGCGDVLVVADDSPPGDESPPPQGVPAGSVSIDEQIKRLEELPAMVKDEVFVSPVDSHEYYDMKAEQHTESLGWCTLLQIPGLKEQQCQQNLNCISVQGRLERMEIDKPSRLPPANHVLLLDRWFASRCIFDPKLDEARRDSSCFEWICTLKDEGIDVPLTAIPELRKMDDSLLRIERGWQDMGRVEPWVCSPEVDAWTKDLGEYGSLIDMDAVHEEALQYTAECRAKFDARKAAMIKQQLRFNERKEQAEQSGPGRVTGSAESKKTASTLNVRKSARQAKYGEYFDSLFTTKLSMFPSLSDVVPKKMVAAVFEGFIPGRQYGGYFPLLE